MSGHEEEHAEIRARMEEALERRQRAADWYREAGERALARFQAELENETDPARRQEILDDIRRLGIRPTTADPTE